jgi:PEP-CTERM motif-containing protein
MKRAQRLLAHTAVVATLALGAGAAQAIPLTFAFTATVRETNIFDESGHVTSDPSHNGEAVNGAIVVETDGLFRDTFNDDFGTSLLFFQLTNAGLFSSTLTIGGTAVDVLTYANDTGSLRVIDSNGPVPCGDGCSTLTPDQVGVGVGSTNFPRIFDEPLSGAFDSRSLGLGWFDPDNPLGLVDLSNPFEPLDVLNIPLRQVFGSFSQQTETCVDSLCSFTSDISTIFTINSFTVTAATVPVPEPGTLSLFLLGLLATAGARSRRAVKSSDRN